MSIKINRVRKLSATARFPRTFDARIATIPETILAALTARQIAELVDGPLAANYAAGHSAGYRDAQ